MEANYFKGKKLLILGGAYVHSKIVEAAKRLGIYTTVTDYLQPEKSPAKLIADEHWEIDITNVDDIVERSKKVGIDGVLAFCLDPAQLPYQQICEKLGVPCYGTKEQFEILVNKLKFKDYCKKHGVDVISEYTEKDIEEGRVELPIIIKPSICRGSRGITICNTTAEIKDAMKRASAESKDGKIIIEKYMGNAQDMAFSYVVIDHQPYLLKIGDRFLGDSKDGLDRQQIATILPSKNTESYLEEVDPKVKAMIKSLGIKFGAVFLQGFWDNGKVYFYDPGMRFPGSDFDLVLKRATGYDNMATFVKFAITGNIDSQKGDPENAFLLNQTKCLILSIACRPGKIRKIAGIKTIEKHPDVLSTSLRYEEGDEIPKTGDIRQRVAEFVVHLPDYKSIKEFIDFVYSNLQILDNEGRDMIVSKIDINHIK